MTTLHTRLAAGLAATAAIVVLSSCSTATKDKEASSASGASASSSAAVSAEAAAHNSDDVMFAQMMIPHHEQAVELSAMAPQHTTNADLIALAGEILKAQQPEINTMKTQLVQWGANPDDPTTHGTHGAMSGMVDDATMAKLKTLQGNDFDKLWLQSMISHHEGAIAMAKTEVADGKNADMKELAQGIITGQQTEIDQMKKMLAAAGG